MSAAVFCACGMPASQVLTVHAVHECSVNPTRVAAMCAYCIREAERQVQIVVDAALSCNTCGLTIHDKGDIVLGQQPIEG